MSVFQRRLASSTYALLRSFERRIAKLDGLIADVEDGKLTMDQLMRLQQQIAEEGDVLDSKTADEESTEDGQEENEAAEDRLLRGVIAVSLADLRAEREQVEEAAWSSHGGSMTTSTWSRSSNAAGDHHGPEVREGKVARFHRAPRQSRLPRPPPGRHGLHRPGRRDPRRDALHRAAGAGRTVPQAAGRGRGAFPGGTDAAGEGINLQFCWVMVNFDVPWNPARLEQRMGRIHRYGQKHDPVIILNLVAAKTREGRVLKTLLDKLEKIRKQLKSDKVFDVIGRIFEGVSIRQYMEQALTEEGAAVRHGATGRAAYQGTGPGPGRARQAALRRWRRRVQGTAPPPRRHRAGGLCPVAPRLRSPVHRRSGSAVGIGLEGDLDGLFAVKPLKRRAIDPLLPVLETYPPAQHGRLTVYRPKPGDGTIWLHPGEAVFEALRGMVDSRLGGPALQRRHLRRSHHGYPLPVPCGPGLGGTAS